MRAASTAPLLVALLACGASGDPDDSGVDARSTGRETDAASDVARDLDAGRADATELDATELDARRSGLAVRTILTLSDGRAIAGEIFAEYDHALFWDRADRVSLGVYRDELFAAHPDDRSVTIVDAAEVVRRTSDGVARSFLSARRDNGWVIERPPLDGVNYVITGGESYHLEENGFGQFAWDIVRTRDERRFSAGGFSNTDFFVWGERVYLPTGGVVVEVEASGEDNLPGSYPADAVNNLVGVHLGGGYYLYVLHFRQHSIAADVVVGARLGAGHYLGLAGNSGVSLEPHVHIALLAVDADHAPIRSWSVPMELRDGYVSRGETGGEPRDYTFVRGGEWIAAERF